MLICPLLCESHLQLSTQEVRRSFSFTELIERVAFFPATSSTSRPPVPERLPSETGNFSLTLIRESPIDTPDLHWLEKLTFSLLSIIPLLSSGVPDGLKVDTSGNVYVGCGDGVHVWNPDGDLLGKIFLGTGSANLAFAGDAGLVILAETKIFLAKFGASAPDLWSY